MARCPVYETQHLKGNTMKQFIFAIGALAFCVLAWIAIFDSMAKHAVEYQECGGQYCKPIDPPLKG
jgi:hypothetical protein